MSDESKENHSAFDNLERAEKDLLETYGRHLSGRSVGYRHFYLCGIARRALAQSRAFKSCLEDRNALVALAILRLQLDTMLRAYALYFVDDPESFAHEVFQGKQIDRIKAADGKLMQDRYLIDKVMPRNPWVESVYKNTSGLIHFSDRHIKAAIHNNDLDKGALELFISSNDPSHEMDDFEEAIEAFFHVTLMIQVVAEDWFSRVDPKSNGSAIEIGD